MQWVFISVAACLVWVTSAANASTGSPSSTLQGVTETTTRSMEPAHKDLNKPRVTPREALPSRPILEEPIKVKDLSSGAADKVRSLATGDSAVNAWFPGRGAIGVNVKVTW